MVMKSHAEGDAAADGQTLQIITQLPAWPSRAVIFCIPAPPWSIYLECGRVRRTVLLTAPASCSHRAPRHLRTCRFLPLCSGLESALDDIDFLWRTLSSKDEKSYLSQVILQYMDFLTFH